MTMSNTEPNKKNTAPRTANAVTSVYGEVVGVPVRSDNGWCVFDVRRSDGETVRATGVIFGIKPGDKITMKGRYEMFNGRRQMNVTDWQIVNDRYLKGIEYCLSSGIYRGIGAARAHEIVERFGERTINILDNHPERLLEIPGITESVVMGVRHFNAANPGLRRMMIALMQYDIAPEEETETTKRLFTRFFIEKMVKEHGPNFVEMVRKNPYLLYELVEGVGFPTADRIAHNMGVEKTSPFRIKAGIRYTLSEAADSLGYTFLSEKTLTHRVMTDNVLGLEQNDRILVSSAISEMAKEENGQIVTEGHKVYLRYYYNLEKQLAKEFARIAGTGKNSSSRRANAEVDVEAIERSYGYTFDPLQAEAIRRACKENVFVLTGGPGTGKTSSVRAIIDGLYQSGKSPMILVAAPTGRAALRVREQMGGLEATTIHSLLGFDGEKFEMNARNKLAGDVLVIDESSMINGALMLSLLEAVPSGMKVIIVGDPDQLPSIGAGNVLSDLIKSGVIPSVKLETVFRQSQKSDIVMGAHKINNGTFPSMEYVEDAPNVKMITEGVKENRSVDVAIGEDGLPVIRSIDGADFLFIEEEDSERVRSIITRLYTEDLPRMGYTTDDVQIISAMKGEGISASTVNLNSDIREVVNPVGLSMVYRDVEYRVGDKVLLTKNNHKKDIYNGDLGYIEALDYEENSATIRFGGNRVVTLKQDELMDLSLGYSITVHKSQGSEFKVILCPVDRQMNRMMTRKNIYTAATRAKSLVIFVGQTEQLQKAIGRKEYRNTSLADNLVELMGEKKQATGEETVMESARERKERLLEQGFRNDLAFGYVAGLLDGVGINVHYATEKMAKQRLRTIAEDDKLRFVASDGQRLKDYLWNNNYSIVAPGLKEGVPVVSLDDADIDGALPENIEDVKAWAFSNLVGAHHAHTGSASEYRFSISKNLIDKDILSFENPDEEPLRRAIALRLADIVESAVDTEIYSVKTASGMAIYRHILYNTVSIDGKYYRIRLEGYYNSSNRAFAFNKFDISPLPDLMQEKLAGAQEVEDVAAPEIYPASVFFDGVYEHRGVTPVLEAGSHTPESTSSFFYNTVNPYRAHLEREVYGWCEGKDIYLTREGLNLHTALHEYAHLWAKSIEMSSPKAWELIKDFLLNEVSEEWEKLASDDTYAFQLTSDDRIASELLARIMERDGSAAFMNAFGKILAAGKEQVPEERMRQIASNLIPDADLSAGEWISAYREKGNFTQNLTNRILSDMVLRHPLHSMEMGEQVEFSLNNKPNAMETSQDSPYDFSRFTSFTGIEVYITHSEEGFDPMGMIPVTDFRSKMAGWFDEDANAIRIYLDPEYKNFIPEHVLARLNQKVLFLAIMKRGIHNLIIPERKMRFASAARRVEEKNGTYLSDIIKGSEKDRWKVYQDLSAESSEVHKAMLELYSNVFGFEFPQSVGKMISTAQRVYCFNRSKEIMDSRNNSAKAADFVEQFLRSGSNTINIGHVTEPYKRLRFPSMQLGVHRGALSYLLHKENLNFRSINDRFLEKLQNPIAIIQNGSENKYGAKQFYVITDVKLPGGDYLCYTINPLQVESARKEQADTLSPKHIFVNPIPLSLAAIFDMVESSNQNDVSNEPSEKNYNILYLSEGKNGYDLLNLIEVESTKNGASLITHLHASKATPLRITANIRNNFRNPKVFVENPTSDDKRMSPSRSKNAVKVETENTASEPISEPSPDKNSVLPGKESAGKVVEDNSPATPLATLPVQPEKTLQERLSIGIPQRLLSKSAYNKLEKAKILNVGDLRLAGIERLKALVGETNTRKLVSFAEDIVGVSLHPRRHAPKESEFLQLDSEQKLLARKRDFIETYVRIDKNMSDNTVLLPVDKDGRPFVGEDLALLIGKCSVIGKKWEGCPVFWTREELTSVGFEPNPDAEPTHILVGEEFHTVYNLKETSFVSRSPELFEKYMSSVQVKSPKAPVELVNYLSMFKLPYSRLDMDVKNTVFPMLHLKYAVNSELENIPAKPRVSFKSVIGKVGLNAMMENVNQVPGTRKDAESNRAVSSPSTEKGKDPEKKSASTPEWFAKLQLVDKLSNLGYLSMKEAHDEVLGRAGNVTFSKEDFTELNARLNQKFVSLSKGSQEDIRKRHELLEEIGTKLPPGQYDLSESSIKCGQLYADILSVSANHYVSVLIKNPYNASLNTVRRSSLDRAFLFSVMEYLSSKQNVRFDVQVTPQMKQAETVPQIDTELFKNSRALMDGNAVEIFGIVQDALSGGHYFSTAEHPYPPVNRDGIPFEGPALLVLSLAQASSGYKSNVWLRENDKYSFYHADAKLTCVETKGKYIRFFQVNNAEMSYGPSMPEARMNVWVSSTKFGVEAYKQAVREYERQYPSSVLANIYFAIITQYGGESFRMDSLGNMTGVEEKAALLNDLILVGTRCQRIAKQLRMELVPSAVQQMEEANDRAYTKDGAMRLADEFGLKDELQEALDSGMGPQEALVHIGLVEDPAQDESFTPDDN